MIKKKILAIPGSIRVNSSNKAILNTIAESFKNEFVLDIYTEIDQLPHFSPDTQEGNNNYKIKELERRIAESDAVIVCTPEYVFSIPSILKNALEWMVSSTVFSYKPIAFIVASASGQKAYESLDIILSTLTQVPIEDDLKLLIKGGQKFVSEDGLVTDPEKRENIRLVVYNLMERVK